MTNLSDTDRNITFQPDRGWRPILNVISWGVKIALVLGLFWLGHITSGQWQ